MQFYTTVPLNTKRETKMLQVWYPKKRADWDTIHEENNIISECQEANKTGNAYLFSNENGASERLWDSLSIVTNLLQDQ